MLFLQIFKLILFLPPGENIGGNKYAKKLSIRSLLIAMVLISMILVSAVSASDNNANAVKKNISDNFSTEKIS